MVEFFSKWFFRLLDLWAMRAFENRRADLIKQLGQAAVAAEIAAHDFQEIQNALADINEAIHELHVKQLRDGMRP